MDYGLLGGLAEGVKAGFGQYQQAKKNRAEQERFEADRADKERGLMQESDYKNRFLEQQATLKREDMANQRTLKSMELSKRGLIDPLDAQLKEAQIKKIESESNQAKAPAQGALNAKQYSDRMKEAEKIFGSVKGFDPTSFRSPESLTPEVLKSQGRKSYDTAVKAFAMGLLRKESGAAISPAEFESVEKTYFPQAGDAKNVIAQKAQLRANEIGNIERESQPAMAYQQQKGLLPSMGNVAQQQTPAQDSQVAAWAKQHNMPYEQAASIIEQRKAATVKR